MPIHLNIWSFWGVCFSFRPQFHTIYWIMRTLPLWLNDLTSSNIYLRFNYLEQLIFNQNKPSLHAFSFIFLVWVPQEGDRAAFMSSSILRNVLLHEECRDFSTLHGNSFLWSVKIKLFSWKNYNIQLKEDGSAQAQDKKNVCNGVKCWVLQQKAFKIKFPVLAVGTAEYYIKKDTHTG